MLSIAENGQKQLLGGTNHVRQTITRQSQLPYTCWREEGRNEAQDCLLTVSGKEFLKSEIAGTSGAIRVFFEYPLVDFFTVHLDFGRRRDSDTYLITSYAQYCNSYIITDDKLLPDPSSQNEHSPTLFCV
jgi:hypothetical protein